MSDDFKHEVRLFLANASNKKEYSVIKAAILFLKDLMNHE